MHAHDAPRVLLLLAFIACMVAALPAATADAGKRRHSTDCDDATVQPASDNIRAVRAAVLCLHNRVRADYGLPPLRESAKLRRAAAGHSADMVANQFFAHESASGADMTDRILATGYAHDRGWSIGENIAWGTGDLATAARIQRAWMHSPGHRANILRGEFREIGIGIALGAPVAAGGLAGATYTTDFGVRR